MNFLELSETRFLQFGYDATSCDLLATEKAGPHIIGDVRDILDNDWDLIIAHPPCTYLTNAGVRHLHDHVFSKNGNKALVSGKLRWQLMRRAAVFFNCFKECKCNFVAIENPIPHKYARELIGDYDQLVQPYHFGHGETKATCFWLKGLPLLKHTHTHIQLKHHFLRKWLHERERASSSFGISRPGKMEEPESYL